MHVLAYQCVCVRVSVREGGREGMGEVGWGWGGRRWWELTDGRLWILHSTRIKAAASPKVINLPAVLTTTPLLFLHISLTQQAAMCTTQRTTRWAPLFALSTLKRGATSTPADTEESRGCSSQQGRTQQTQHGAARKSAQRSFNRTCGILRIVSC